MYPGNREATWKGREVAWVVTAMKPGVRTPACGPGFFISCWVALCHSFNSSPCTFVASYRADDTHLLQRIVLGKNEIR